MDQLAEPVPPPGWGVKFSAKRSLWYFYNLRSPRTTKWAQPGGPAEDQAAALSRQLSHLSVEPELVPAAGSRRIVLVRHAYRMDEHDTRWIDKALRPQDSPLAPLGLLQAAALAEALVARQKDWTDEPIVRVLASPFARTVQTAAAVVQQLGLGPSGLAIEQGLCEGADMMARNRLCTEPFFLPAADLCVAAAACGGLDLHYKSAVTVRLR